MKSGPVILWDIECTNLNANFGYILSVAGKALGEKKVEVFDVSKYSSYKGDPTNDKQLVKEAGDYLATAGAWVTWYGARFDVPFINSRRIHHGLTPLPPIPHIDGWRIAKYKLRMNSNRLASVSSFLDVSSKTPLDGPTWIKASAGDKKALNYIIKHNVQDVIVLEEVYNKIKPLITSGPNVSLLSGDEKPRTKGQQKCPICSAESLQKRGVNVTTTGFRQRFQCQKCGGWSLGLAVRKEGLEAR